MTDEQYGQIMQSIGELKGKVDVGFDAITRRQDLANGRTGKLEDRVDEIETQQNQAQGRLTAFGWIFSAFIAMGGILLTYMQIFKK